LISVFAVVTASCSSGTGDEPFASDSSTVTTSSSSRCLQSRSRCTSSSGPSG